VTEPKREVQQTDQGVRLEAHWAGDSDVAPIFADQLHVLGLNDTFYMTFGQLRPPVVEKEARPTDVVAEIKVVAKLILPRQALKQIRDLLNSRLEV
jgi:hypothetical protein